MYEFAALILDLDNDCYREMFMNKGTYIFNASLKIKSVLEN